MMQVTGERANATSHSLTHVARKRAPTHAATTCFSGVDLLAARLDDPGAEDHRDLTVPFELVARESTLGPRT